MRQDDWNNGIMEKWNDGMMERWKTKKSCGLRVTG
jgi:hypothetical protein